MIRVCETPAHKFRLLARLCEPVWLRRHLGWRVTAPTNDNGPAPVGAA